MRGKLIVAGGGIGGLAVTLALHRAGIDVMLYERAPVFADIGAGMSLWPNATRVLKILGVLDSVIGLGEPVTQFNLLKPDGTAISKISVEGFKTPALCIHRADLHRSLWQRLPPSCMEANQRLVSFVEDAGGVTTTFAGGLVARAEGLIGADGINSVVRAQLHGAADPVYRGYCIWRGIAPVVAGIARGHISETWGSGKRFGIMPIGQGRICWYATQNCAPSQSDPPVGRKQALSELFKGWHQPIQSLLEATDPNDIIRADARDRRPLRSWGKGRVTLLGDAAHPMTPNVGQGACMAIEDAACLAKLLPKASGVSEAFRSYEAMRITRTAAIARQARRIGFIGQWENPWIIRVRNCATRLVLSGMPHTQLNAVYGYEV
jgi:2-polyprenyl-6-methoxyphenol hydroxylase-like FAD-dependent oxidoreductase